MSLHHTVYDTNINININARVNAWFTAVMASGWDMLYCSRTAVNFEFGILFILTDTHIHTLGSCPLNSLISHWAVGAEAIALLVLRHCLFTFPSKINPSCWHRDWMGKIPVSRLFFKDNETPPQSLLSSVWSILNSSPSSQKHNIPVRRDIVILINICINWHSVYAQRNSTRKWWAKE